MRGLGTALAVLLVAALASATARADFTPATLISGTPRIEFDQANAPGISKDGHYVVFQGALAGDRGVWRRDLHSGEVTPVAVEAYPGLSGKKTIPAPDASAPSISADGRYVAFTTTADLRPQREPGANGEPPADSGCPEVYVRDMEREPSEPGAFTLVAALDGSEEGITYYGAPCHVANPPFEIAGAQAAPGVAISADGRHVAFTVLSRSNLTTGKGAELGNETEPGQVAVRDLETDTTSLVTATPQGRPTPGGGAYPSFKLASPSESEPTPTEFEPVPTAVATAEEGPLGAALTASTAAISADASTVAWLGTNVPEQVPSSEQEIQEKGLAHIRGESPFGLEVEPLWRRIAGGQAAVTRRLLNNAGLDFFFNFGQESGVLDGSLVEGRYAFIPLALSADGSVVAVIANAPAPAAEASWYQSGRETPTTNAYVVRVGSDPASPPQVTVLTSTPDYAVTTAALGGVTDVAISPDGARVAFEAARSEFTLPSLALISPPLGVAAGSLSQTYVANLEQGTLQRVTSTYDGAGPNAGAGLLAFTGDGQTLAFASRATNLFYGDSVSASEVYLVREVPSSDRVAPQEVGPPFTRALPGPEWTLSATASAQADGSVLLDVHTPGAGRLAVAATAQLPASAPRSGSSRRSRGRRSTSGRSKNLRTGRAGGLAIRTVARAASVVDGASDLRLRLRPPARYRRLVSSSDGLYAVLRVIFFASAHRTLAQEIPVTFRIAVHRSRARKRMVKR